MIKIFTWADSVALIVTKSIKQETEKEFFFDVKTGENMRLWSSSKSERSVFRASIFDVKCVDRLTSSLLVVFIK